MLLRHLIGFEPTPEPAILLLYLVDRYVPALQFSQ